MNPGAPSPDCAAAIEALRPALAAARRAVVLTGAGISAESGLGTFRGPGGLWERARPEDLATPGAFVARPGVVWRWYADRWRSMRDAEPNAGHAALAGWGRLFDRFLLVTQNIDRLHRRAGSSADETLELHGTLALARCVACDRRLPMDEAIELPADPGEAPRCGRCGGRYRPDVVWFGEPLPPGALERATAAAAACDLFVAVGTSRTVQPAAGLIAVAGRVEATVVEVNPDASAFSGFSVGLAGPAGLVLPRLTAVIEAERGLR